MVPNLFYEMPGYSAMGASPGASAGAVSGRTAARRRMRRERMAFSEREKVAARVVKEAPSPKY